MLSFGSFVRGKVTQPRGIPLNWHSLELIIYIYIIKEKKKSLSYFLWIFFSYACPPLVGPSAPLLHPLFQSGKNQGLLFSVLTFQMDWKLFIFGAIIIKRPGENGYLTYGIALHQ